MKTTANLMLIGAMLVLSSCDLFVPPKVACDTVILTAGLSSQATRKGIPCAFGDLAWQVAHAPKVDETWAKENGGSGNKSLAGMPVTVTGVGAGLCEGVPEWLPEDQECNVIADTTEKLDTHVDSMGLLTYRTVMSGFLVGEGEEVTISGVIVNEVYGPGNQCNIEVQVTASCATAPDTSNP